MSRPRSGIGAELVLLVLILAGLAGSLAMIVAIHRRNAPRRPSPAAVALAPTPSPPKPAPSTPAPVVPEPDEPEPPTPPTPEDPTPKALAKFTAAEAEQLLETSRADRKAAALEEARKLALAQSERWRRRESLVRLQLDSLDSKVRKMETQVDELALERDALEKERDARKAMASQARSRPGQAILPHRGQNGTWRRPIVIECRNGMAILQPQGHSFGLLDLASGFGPSSNPFVAAVAREAIRIQGHQSPDGQQVVPYIFFLVRPDGIRPYYEARGRLEPLGITFGYELADQDWEIDIPNLDDVKTWDGSAPSTPRSEDPFAPDPVRPPGASPAEDEEFPSWGSRRPGTMSSHDEGPGSEFTWPPRPRPSTGGSVRFGNAVGSRAGEPGGDPAAGPSGIPDGLDPLGSGSGLPVGLPRGADGPLRPLGGDRSRPASRPVTGVPGDFPPGSSGPGSASTRASGSLADGSPARGAVSGRPGATGTGDLALASSANQTGAGARGTGNLPRGLAPGGIGEPGAGNLPPGGSPPNADPSEGQGGAKDDPANTLVWPTSPRTGNRGTPGTSDPGAPDQSPPVLHTGPFARPLAMGLDSLASSANPSAPNSSDPGDPSQLEGSSPSGTNPTTGHSGRAGASGGSSKAQGSGGSQSASKVVGPAGSSGGQPSSGSPPPSLASAVGLSGMPSMSMNPPGSPSSSTAPPKDGKRSLAMPDPGSSSIIDRRYELVVVCGPRGVIVQPGGYRVTADALKDRDGLMKKQMVALVKAKRAADPKVIVEPKVRFLIQPGGDKTFWAARSQFLLSGLDWPMSFQVADPDPLTILPSEGW